MSVACKDGAWLSITEVIRLDCNKCGVVLTTVRSRGHWQQDELLRRHAIDKHGGIDR